MIVLYCILGLLGALILFMVVRTLVTRPRATQISTYQAPPVDRDKLVAELQGAVRIPTVTLEHNDEDGSVFFEYQHYLETTYPALLGSAQKINVNRYAVIYIVKGTDSALLPVAVLAHQDVVPAPEEGWEVPPFSGEVKDGCVYGRGSQDMKSQMIAALHALNVLVAEGKPPKRTVYFCFGHDEERQGYEGARHIVAYLKEKGIRFESVIDEGGTILDGSILGIPNKVALIGTCEKGYADITLEVEKLGGHASTPTRRTAVGMLSEAIADIEHTPMPTHWTVPTKQMIKTLAPYMKFPFRLIFVNRDVLSPLLKRLLSIVNPFTNCLVRTTFAPTQTAGSTAPNVLPPRAKANINVRINTGETVEDVCRHIRNVVGKKVKVEPVTGYFDPSPVSSVTSDAYKKLTKTIAEVFNGYIAAPYPFIAASDAKYYYALSDNVYRFTPFEKTVEDANRIHACNERQNIDSLVVGTQFFLRYFENTCY